MHDWIKSVTQGQPQLTCSRCGTVSDGPGAYLNPPSVN
jgi:hypothetical protein